MPPDTGAGARSGDIRIGTKVMPAVDVLQAGGASVVETGSAAMQGAPSVTAMAGRTAPVMLAGVASAGTAGRLIARSVSRVELMPRLTDLPSERAVQIGPTPSQQAPGRAAGPGAAKTAAETELRRRENTVLPALRPPHHGDAGGKKRLPVTVGDVRNEVRRDELPSLRRGQERMALPTRRVSRAVEMGIAPASPASRAPSAQSRPVETRLAATSVMNMAMTEAPGAGFVRQPLREPSSSDHVDVGQSSGGLTSRAMPRSVMGDSAAPGEVRTVSAVSLMDGFMRTGLAIPPEGRADLARPPVRGANPAVPDDRVNAARMPAMIQKVTDGSSGRETGWASGTPDQSRATAPGQQTVLPLRRAMVEATAASGWSSASPAPWTSSAAQPSSTWVGTAPPAADQAAAPAPLPAQAAAAAAGSDLEQLADQVYHLIERRLRIERESLGL